MEEGFSRSLILPDSHKHDSVLCVELADVDWDGQQEIILGTFGKVYANNCLSQRDIIYLLGYPGVQTVNERQAKFLHSN